jgi:hypothetical protein
MRFILSLLAPISNMIRWMRPLLRWINQWNSNLSELQGNMKRRYEPSLLFLTMAQNQVHLKPGLHEAPYI